jgi:hypothetical protein
MVSRQENSRTLLVDWESSMMISKQFVSLLAGMAVAAVLTWLVYPSGLADGLYFVGFAIFFSFLFQFLGRRDRSPK